MPGTTDLDIEIRADYMKSELPEREWREIDREASYWLKSLSNGKIEAIESEKRISTMPKSASMIERHRLSKSF